MASWRNPLEELLGNINGGGSSSTVPTIGENGLGGDLFGGMFAGISKLMTNVLPKELAGAIKSGFKEANLGGIIGDALSDIPFINLKMRVLETFKTMSDEMTKDWAKVDQAAFNYGKKLGLAGDQVVRLRNEMIRFGVETKTAINYGKSIDELIKLQSDYASVIGRNVRLSKEQLEDAAALSSFLGDDSVALKFAGQLENFGLTMSDAGNLMAEMYNKSLKDGVSLEKYAQNVTDNLHIAQQYTFKNGVKGLVSMAEQAAKMKLDISEAVKLAEKVSTIEGAVDVSSQLQVLGGQFAAFADPMGLLYDSLNNMEGMQDRLTDLVKDMGYFNKMTGEIEIANFDKIRLRQAASAMGVDYGKLIDSATQQAKRGEVEAQMRGLSNIPQEYKELLMNTAMFQNGVAGITGSDGTFKSLATLDGKDLKMLAQNSKSDSDNIRDIAQMLRGMTDITEGEQKAEADARTSMFREQGDIIKEGYKRIAENTKILEQLVKLQFAKSVKDVIVSPVLKTGESLLDILNKVVAKKEHGGIVRTHSEGDLITNGTPGKEYILNSAQHGEFIVNKDSTSQHLGLLRAINADKSGSLKIKTHQFGGMPFVNDSLPASMALGMFGGLNIYSHQKDELTATLKSLQKELENVQWMRSRVELKTKGRKELDAKENELSENISELSDSIGDLDIKSDKLAKFVKIGAGALSAASAGIGAWSSASAQYKADGIDILDKGKAVGGKVGGAVTAGVVGGLTMMIPAIGPVLAPIAAQFAGKLGQKLGEELGDINAEKSVKEYYKIQEGLTNKHGKDLLTEINPSQYSKKEIQAIGSALSDGKIRKDEISSDLFEKLKTLGDDNIVVSKHKYGGMLHGASHENGGIMLHEAEGGEFVVNKESSKRSMGLLTNINNGIVSDNSIKPLEPMGKQMQVVDNNKSVNGSKSLKMEPINININGSIKLEGGGQNLDISKEIFNNPTLINKITDIILKQINIDENGGFNVQSYYRRFTSV